MGGKPSKGTSKDMRLKENQTKPTTPLVKSVQPIPQKKPAQQQKGK